MFSLRLMKLFTKYTRRVSSKSSLNGIYLIRYTTILINTYLCLFAQTHPIVNLFHVTFQLLNVVHNIPLSFSSKLIYYNCNDNELYAVPIIVKLNSLQFTNIKYNQNGVG